MRACARATPVRLFRGGRLRRDKPLRRPCNGLDPPIGGGAPLPTPVDTEVAGDPSVRQKAFRGTEIKFVIGEEAARPNWECPIFEREWNRRGIAFQLRRLSRQVEPQCLAGSLLRAIPDRRPCQAGRPPPASPTPLGDFALVAEVAVEEASACRQSPGAVTSD